MYSIFLRISVCFLLSCCLALPAPVLSATAEFNAGLAQYNQRQFGPAITTFRKIMQSEPNNVAAAYYLANCYYQLGQMGPAAKYYEWITTAFPKSSEAVSAQAMLNRMGAGSKSVNSASAIRALDTGAKAAAGGSKSATASASEIQVVVIKPLGDHPACTPDFIKQVKAAVHGFPTDVIALAARNNCHIYVTPTMIDKYPELKNTRPATYEQGHTYKNCPALFERPNVVVCQYAIIGEDDDNNWQLATDPIGSLRHEFGHAVDAFMGYISSTEDFRHVYEMERTRITDPDTRSQLSYYVQDSRDRDLGTSETFAEGCSIVFGGAESSWRVKSQTSFKNSFPRILTLIKQKLNDL
jgi:hypothetical protein